MKQNVVDLLFLATEILEESIDFFPEDAEARKQIHSYIDGLTILANSSDPSLHRQVVVKSVTTEAKLDRAALYRAAIAASSGAASLKGNSQNAR